MVQNSDVENLESVILGPVLEEWVENHIQQKPNVYLYLSSGKEESRRNMYDCFSRFVAKKQIFDRVPQRKFVKRLFELLEEKNIRFYKHRMAKGFAVYGIDVVE